jgi:hypothetical protein
MTEIRPRRLGASKGERSYKWQGTCPTVHRLHVLEAGTKCPPSVVDRLRTDKPVWTRFCKRCGTRLFRKSRAELEGDRRGYCKDCRQGDPVGVRMMMNRTGLRGKSMDAPVWRPGWPLDADLAAWFTRVEKMEADVCRRRLARDLRRSKIYTLAELMDVFFGETA